MFDQMFHLEKIHLLRAAEQHFNAVRWALGEPRRGVTDQLNRLKAAAAREFHSDEEIATLEKRASTVEAEFTTAYDAWQASTRLLQACEQWIRQQGKVVPEAKSGPARPRLALAGRADEQIEQLRTVREKIAAEEEKFDQIEFLPSPAKEVIEEKHREIDAILDKICDPKQLLAYVETPLLLIAINADTLKRTISSRLETTIGKNGIAQTERLARTSAILRTIGELRREEEKICLSIEAAGEYVSRREDFPPAVFFEVAMTAVGGTEMAAAQ